MPIGHHPRRDCREGRISRDAPREKRRRAGRAALKIVCGDTLALTPPMGWNSWYIHYNRVSEVHLREAAGR